MTDQKLTPEQEAVEVMARQIHGVYCQYRREVHGEEYWTKGNYDLLDDKTKEADRYMARFALAVLSEQNEENARLRKAIRILQLMVLDHDTPPEGASHE